MPPLSPQPIMDAMTAYQRTAALKAAIALDVFGHARGGADAAELARRCNAAERGIRILCDTLTVQGFLAKDGAGRYSPSPESAAFLDRASPTYLGGIADF